MDGSETALQPVSSLQVYGATQDDKRNSKELNLLCKGMNLY